MLGYLDIVSSISHLMLKRVIASIVLLFDFSFLRKHYYYHCYNNRDIIMNINQPF